MNCRSPVGRLREERESRADRSAGAGPAFFVRFTIGKRTRRIILPQRNAESAKEKGADPTRRFAVSFTLSFSLLTFPAFLPEPGVETRGNGRDQSV